MSNKLKVGIIGTGHMGQYHVNIYSLLPEVDIIGIYDANPKTAKRISEKYNTKMYETEDALLKDVDAVSIAVPTKLHYSTTMKAFEYGKHVLLEKPMTNNIDHARELVEIAKKKEIIFHLGHVERFNGAVQGVKKIINNPYIVEARRLHPMDKKRHFDTGVILDLMIHDVDIILRLFDQRIKNVSAFGRSVFTDYIDVANAQMMFENGSIATISSSRVTQEKIRTLSISQEDAYIYLNYASQDIQIYRRPDSKTRYYISPQEIRFHEEMVMERLYIHKENALKLELEHFISCINNGDHPVETSDNDLYALEITLEILKKIEESKV